MTDKEKVQAFADMFERLRDVVSAKRGPTLEGKDMPPAFVGMGASTHQLAIACAALLSTVTMSARTREGVLHAGWVHLMNEVTDQLARKNGNQVGMPSDSWVAFNMLAIYFETGGDHDRIVKAIKNICVAAGDTDGSLYERIMRADDHPGMAAKAEQLFGGGHDTSH